jgi:hypothetical protein
MLLLFATSCILTYHLGVVKNQAGDMVGVYPVDPNGWAVCGITGLVFLNVPLPGIFWGLFSIAAGVAVGGWWRNRILCKRGCTPAGAKAAKQGLELAKRIGPPDELGMTDEEIAEKHKQQGKTPPEKPDEE